MPSTSCYRVYVAVVTLETCQAICTGYPSCTAFAYRATWMECFIGGCSGTLTKSGGFYPDTCTPSLPSRWDSSTTDANTNSIHNGPGLWSGGGCSDDGSCVVNALQVFDNYAVYTKDDRKCNSGFVGFDGAKCVRECVACSACGANLQVETECNSTQNITCKACQANSWSYAGRILLEPCFCNTGYELQGILCVSLTTTPQPTTSSTTPDPTTSTTPQPTTSTTPQPTTSTPEPATMSIFRFPTFPRH